MAVCHMFKKPSGLYAKPASKLEAPSSSKHPIAMSKSFGLVKMERYPAKSYVRRFDDEAAKFVLLVNLDGKSIPGHHEIAKKVFDYVLQHETTRDNLLLLRDLWAEGRGCDSSEHEARTADAADEEPKCEEDAIGWDEDSAESGAYEYEKVLPFVLCKNMQMMVRHF